MRWKSTQELSDEEEPREALGKRAVPVEVGLGDAGVGAQPLVAPFAHAGEGGEQVGLGPVFGEEHLDQLLELEDGSFARCRHPFARARRPLAVMV